MRNAILVRGMSVNRLALFLSAMAVSCTTFAAGINSNTYTCSDLQDLIMANRFIFINNPNFYDFVVADVSLCPGGSASGARLQTRSVPTTDRPECLVKYCLPSNNNSGN